MEVVPYFTAKCEAIMGRNKRREKAWFEAGLKMALEQLHEQEKNLAPLSDARQSQLRALEVFLFSWVIGNKGLDARASVAWRNVGVNDFKLDYLKDLAPIERRVATSILMLTGHVKSKKKRFTLKRVMKVAGATIIGGGLLAASGALAAPIVGAALAGTAAGTSAFLTSTFGMGVVAGVFGAFGANRTAWKMMKREGGLKEFLFIPTKLKPGSAEEQAALQKALKKKDDDKAEGEEEDDDAEEDTEEPGAQQLHCVLGISGWIQKEELEEIGGYWATALASVPSSERWALIFDRKVLEAYGNALRKFVVDQGLQSVALHAAVFAGGHAVMAAAAPPAMALMLQDVVDSPFAVAKKRAKLAGEELARALHGRAFSNRPVSLVGFGFGATAIFTCLERLAEEKGDTEGLVQDVVLFGAPMRVSPERWRATTRIVAGKYVNCYCSKDKVLSLLLRLSTKSYPAAGIQPLGVEGIVDKPIDSTAYEIGTIPGLIQFYMQDILEDAPSASTAPPT